ncbi:MAG: HAMP domain-containing protein [Alphaproteobacteria bacterium]|nr:HAMP domain-containing protein [Alphaproteobacteria bacterium]
MRRFPALWPRSLAARTALVLLAGLIVVQAAGLTIHALDRMDVQRLAEMRSVASRVMSLYRTIVMAPADQRGHLLRELQLPPGLSAKLRDAAPDEMMLMPQGAQRMLDANMAAVPLPAGSAPTETVMLGGPGQGRIIVGLRLPEGQWLNSTVKVNELAPWHSRNFLISFGLMTAAAALLAVWAVRRMTAPVTTLAAAAERLGRDVNAPPMPEDGPLEVAKAAAAFNLMAARIRRFVQDRTFMLTAIGHDLRTPITRLKLRTEFMDDDELRRKMLTDIDELEAMVEATVAFGRDATASEPMTSLDLAVLARTVVDEAADARPEIAERLDYEGPEHLTVRARSLGVKRAIANLVANAVKYGGGAHVRLRPPQDGVVYIDVEDEGPGIPPAELERVFQPFHRVEPSRNRETGGVGLGLPIARNIMRAHGGDVTLANRPLGGTRATVSLPT